MFIPFSSDFYVFFVLDKYAHPRYLQPVINKVGFPSLVLPSGVSVEADQVGGVEGEWLLPEDEDESRVLLWVSSVMWAGAFFGTCYIKKCSS